jgi:hypothetical protein
MSDRIHATVRKHLGQKIKDDVEEGSAYVVEKSIFVVENDTKYKITPHKYKLNCMLSTNFIKINDDHVPISHFDFVLFNETLNSPNEDRIIH